MPSDKPFPWLLVLPVGLMFATLVPIKFFVERLDVVLGIPPGSAMSPANAAIWTVMMIVIVVANFAAGAAMGCLANVLICRYLLGWPSEKIRTAFVKSLAPEMRAPVPSSDKPPWWFSVLPGVFGFASFAAWIYFIFWFMNVWDIFVIPMPRPVPLSTGSIIERIIFLLSDIGFGAVMFVYIICFIVAMFVIMMTGSTIGYLANVLICRYLLGWSAKEIRATFVKEFKNSQIRGGPGLLMDAPYEKMRIALIKWLENDEKWRWLEGDERSSEK